MRHLSLRSVRTLVVSSLFGLVVVAAATTSSAGESNDGVACRTHSADHGTQELTLRWNGKTAKGTLQQTAPSGNVTTVNVRAEKLEGMVIADDINQKDLVVHAAVIRSMNGKRYMRTEAAASWLACE